MDLSTVLPGKVLFQQGIHTSGSLEFGIDYFNSNGAVAQVSNNPNDSTSASYTTSSNILTLNQQGGLIDTITVSYIDSLQGLWTESANDDTTGVGSYVFLQSWKPSDIAGKTLTPVSYTHLCDQPLAQVDPELPFASGSNRAVYFSRLMGAAISRTASMSCFAGTGGMRA